MLPRRVSARQGTGSSPRWCQGQGRGPTCEPRSAVKSWSLGSVQWLGALSVVFQSISGKDGGGREGSTVATAIVLAAGEGMYMRV